jgi:hypothetical protein
MQSIVDAKLLQHDRGLATVRCLPTIKIDHMNTLPCLI